MQPHYEITLTRPWHWGIAIVSGVGAVIPEQRSGIVTATSSALMIEVRHASDVVFGEAEGEQPWATATILVRSLPALAEVPADLLFTGDLSSPGGKLTIGDADGGITIDGLAERTVVRVAGDASDPTGQDKIWIDLAPGVLPPNQL